MEFVLFEDYIPLQALLKKTGVIQSGGAVKEWIANEAITYNGHVETRRRKKVYIGDIITIPSQDITITVIAPTEAEKQEYLAEQEEKARIQARVKALNAATKKQKKQVKKVTKPKTAVRFPGR
ncbi:RNA-binding S4 domain-containing protein [Streptococcus sp. DD12]|uniref:RNA-binding S4 domain-containing protein n=1 Tax=Streptococcus sp. DD12 TaxID=1777880 RepID=UPI00079533F4|nr:RNA-binding S4 domain-containing protein [Streptococcus sp. DD12]KXT76101.1 hypothetical protein STRDD12_01213 [Streptococcus sp. DD12]